MKLTIYPVNWLSNLLTATATVAVIIVSQPVLVMAKTPREIAKIAKPITVQINSRSGDGSGFIVAKDKNTYIVLTNSHVVKENVAYTIGTYDGKKYPVTGVISFQVQQNDPDLAILRFNSPNQYPTAVLGNSNQVAVGDRIYVYGYPSIGGRTGNSREAEFSPGYITSIRRNPPQGYNLAFNAVTWGGMSGSPVLAGNGRVIGVHGAGDIGLTRVLAPDRSGRISRVLLGLPTGFNLAVPINTFINQISKSRLSLSSLKVENSPTKNNQLNLTNPLTAEEFYVRGLINAEKGNNKDAIADYTTALAINPNQPFAYFYRGIARYQMGHNQDAIGFVRFGLEDKQTAIEDFEKAAELFRQQGNYKNYQNVLEAIQEFQR